MVNTNLLKAKIIECGFTQKDLSMATGIGTTALNQKIRGRADFKVSEVQRVCDALNIPVSECGKYFFA